MSDDFKKKNLKKRLTALHEDYEAANNQLSRALNDVERLRLQRLISDLERDIQQVESELERVGTSSHPVLRDTDSLSEMTTAQGIKKLFNDWKWVVGTLVAIIGCIGTWLAVPGVFTFFQGTVTTTPTAISTVAEVNKGVTPELTSKRSDTPTPSPPSSVTLVPTSTMVAVPTEMPTPDSRDEPIIFQVCPKDKETNQIVPDATVEIKVKGETEFTITPKGNGCTEFAFNSFDEGQSGLLVVTAKGYQTYEEYVDIVDGITLQVELERLPTPAPANTPTPAVNVTVPVTPTPVFIPTATPSLPSGRIAFPVDDGQGHYDVWMVDLSTNDGPYLLVNDASQPNFSIKGELLVKTTNGIGWLDAKNAWRGVVSESGFDSHPFWDPDGIRYVFDNYRLLLGRHESNSLMFIPCSLRPPSQETDPICRDIVAKGVLTTGRELSGEYPVWLDDQRIAFRRSEYIQDSGSVGGSQEIGQRGIQLISSGSTPGNIERGIGGYSSVSELKLDGRPTDAYGDRIFFFSSDLTGQEIPGDWEAYSVKADGTDLINLSNNPTSSDGMPTVSPNGQWVAFVSNRGGSWGIWLVSSGSGEPALLVDISMINPNPWASGGRDWTTEHITWGP